MSIIIKGMEMPKSCEECVFRIGRFCTRMSGWHDNIEPFVENQTKSPLCPLIELPPHGDLIDRDALMKKAYDSGQYANAEVGFHQRVVDVEDIEDAPTIIEAEVIP